MWMPYNKYENNFGSLKCKSDDHPILIPHHQLVLGIIPETWWENSGIKWRAKQSSSSKFIKTNYEKTEINSKRKKYIEHWKNEDIENEDIFKMLFSSDHSLGSKRWSELNVDNV